MRVLFVVPPLVGHISPALGVAAELAERGHEIAWAGEERFVRAFAGEDAVVYGCATGWPDDEPPVRPAELRGPAALKFLWEDFLGPLAAAMTEGVEQAIREHRADLVVTDQQTVAGAFAAERAGVPWVTSATTSAELTDPLSGLPKVVEWLEELLDELRRRVDAPATGSDPRFSPLLTIAFSVPELLGPDHYDRTPVRFVGPIHRPNLSPVDPEAEGRSDAFPWRRVLDAEGPVVLVALGTANAEAGERFLRAAREGLAAVDATVIIADPLGMLGEGDEHTVIVPRVPQQRLLPHVDAFVSHAGHNSVCESLLAGAPLVVAPIRDDQPVIAGQVVDAGAGVRLRFARAGAEQIAAAVTEVLGDAEVRENARRLGALLEQAGGAAAAADAIEELARR